MGSVDRSDAAGAAMSEACSYVRRYPKLVHWMRNGDADAKPVLDNIRMRSMIRNWLSLQNVRGEDDHLRNLLEQADAFVNHNGQAGLLAETFRQQRDSGKLDRLHPTTRAVHRTVFSLGISRGAPVLGSLRYLQTAVWAQSSGEVDVSHTAIQCHIKKLVQLGLFLDYAPGKRTPYRDRSGSISLELTPVTGEPGIDLMRELSLSVEVRIGLADFASDAQERNREYLAELRERRTSDPLSKSPLLCESVAAQRVGRAVRVFREIDLPFVQPPGTRRKDQRLYRADVLDAWREANGTWQEVVAAAARRTHTKLFWRGEPYSSSPHYDRWRKMVARCTDPNHPDYADYGGRGIKVHWPWIDDPIAFFDYVESCGPIPPGYSLDRNDNDGNYEPGNLRVVDKKTQNENRRSWADLDAFAPCCWCVDCNHDALTCPVEAFDWAAARRAFGTEHAPPFNWRKARKDYDRTKLGSVIDLPGPEIETRSWADNLMDRYELDGFVRDLLGQDEARQE